MSTPSISVVMSVKNGASFLRESIESILGQSFADFEFIIVNDGSTDGTAVILSEYAKDERVKIYGQSSLGLIASLNRGCRLAQGKYIARMDGDDVATIDRLLWQYSFLEANVHVGAVGGAVEIMNVNGKSLRTYRYPTDDREIRSVLYRGGCPFCHPAVMMRTDAYAAVGGYRKVMVDAEDYDLWLQIADGNQLANLPDVVLKYRRHAAQVSVRKCSQQSLSSTIARAAALHRRTGRPDGLNGLSEITPAVLESLGVTDVSRQSALARGYLTSIQSMSEVGEYSVAGALVDTLRSFDWKSVEKSVFADYLLLSASLQWHERRFFRSAVSVVQALVTRPRTLGRPLKPLLSRLSL